MRAVAMWMVTAASVVGLGACGSSDKVTASNGSAYTSSLALAKCMRAHGVPKFPDPGGSGAVQITPGSGLDPQSPSFQSAQAACGKQFGGLGGGTPGQPSETAKLQMLAIAECFRKHGFASFPDPTTSPPALGSGLATLALGRGGVFLVIPKSIDVRSPAFQQAARTCRFPAPHASAAPAD